MTVDYSGFKLGKQAPSNKPALMLKQILTGVVPATPIAVDHFKQLSSWELGDNDKFGTCGPTSVANHRRLVTSILNGKEEAPSLENIFDLYRRSGNPNFNPNLDSYDSRQEDNGVIMQDMLDALAKDGIGGVKPIAFAKIDPDDMDTLDKAIALFGGVLLGLTLKEAQQTQATWDYVQHSGDWGGHAVLAGKYNDPAGTSNDRLHIITWAEDVATTRNFINYQDDEAWVVIWPEMLRDKTFLEGIDLVALRSAYISLTDRDLPDINPTDPVIPEEPVEPKNTQIDDLLAVALNRFLARILCVPSYLRKAAQAWLDQYNSRK